MTDSIAQAIVDLESRRDRMLAEYQQIEEALNALRRIGTDDERVTAPAERPVHRASGAPPPAPSLVHHNRDQARTAQGAASQAALGIGAGRGEAGDGGPLSRHRARRRP